MVWWAEELTVDVDQHVLGGGLPEVPQAGHAVQRAGVLGPRPVDGEAPPGAEGDLRPVHRHLGRGELPVQGHRGPGGRHLAGQPRGPVGAELDHLVVVGRRHKQLLWICGRIQKKYKMGRGTIIIYIMDSLINKRRT